MQVDEKIKLIKKRAAKVMLILLVIIAGIICASVFLYYNSGLKIYAPAASYTEYFFSCDETDIIIKEDNIWSDFNVKGILVEESGRTADEYTELINKIAGLGANTIRTKSVMEPEFYEALKKFNEQEKTPIYILQGISIGQEAYMDMEDAYTGGMKDMLCKEGRLAIDAVHGCRRSLGYNADISEYVMGYLIGDKWDPDLVMYTNHSHENIAGEFSGKYVSAWETAPVFETILAQVFDDLIGYETAKYNVQHLMGLYNYQSTDALFHDTSWAAGHYENLVNVNAQFISANADTKTGVFAAYDIEAGVYDGLSFDPQYRDYYTEDGVNDPYAGYLTALAQTHSKPTILAGITASSQRGISGKDEIMGFDRGGIGEEKQAEAITTIFNDAVAVGMCGGIISPLEDSTGNCAWNEKDFCENTKNWLNVQDSEQGTGLIALEPAEKTVIDGKSDEWSDEDNVIKEDGFLLSAKQDEKYFYLNINIKDYDKRSDVLYIPMDITPLSGAAQNTVEQISFDRDMDFLITVNGEKRCKLTVQEYYDKTYAEYRKEIWDEEAFLNIPKKDSGEFNDVLQYARERISLVNEDSREAYTANAGIFQFGSSDKESENYNSLADYYIEGDNIEIRIPWALLNFSDPSNGMILHDFYAADGVKSVPIDNIYVGAVLFKNGENKSFDSQKIEIKKWGENTNLSEREKAAYFAVKEVFDSIDD